MCQFEVLYIYIYIFIYMYIYMGKMSVGRWERWGEIVSYDVGGRKLVCGIKTKALHELRYF